jgi:predicted phosphoribosyltransferase
MRDAGITGISTARNAMNITTTDGSASMVVSVPLTPVATKKSMREMCDRSRGLDAP